MVTLTFIPGPSVEQTIKAIKDTIEINLRDARDAIELQRVQCKDEDRQRLIDAIEVVGGMVM